MLVVFTTGNTKIRPYTTIDFKQLSEVYKSAFAEPPWNEYMKCTECGVNYGKDEIEFTPMIAQGRFSRVEYDLMTARYDNCKNCGIDITPEIAIQNTYGDYMVPTDKIIPYWSDEEIQKDLEFAQTQKSPIILVAEDGNRLSGFTWGYRLPIEKFPFLQGNVRNNSNYMDEMAVRGDTRTKGLGTMLGTEYISECRAQGIEQIVLRTDERNAASMALFSKLGFRPLTANGSTTYDPEYPQRIYLSMEVRK
ncbi:MAG: GNAT family N-acetyltransferase [Candidatus Woesearchaeota archaeon]